MLPVAKGCPKKRVHQKIDPTLAGERFVLGVILMSTTKGEKDSLLGQTVLPLELGKFFGGLVFLGAPFNSLVENWNLSVKLKIIGFFRH